jgi:hypothetical protein
MRVFDIVREYKLLLGVTALLSVGSVAAGGLAAIAAGASAIALNPLLAQFLNSLFGNMAAANLHDLAKKLRDSSQVLTNEDLTKAAGKAIALGILNVAQEPSYRDIAPILKDLANCTEGYWLQIERSGDSPGEYAAIAENQLRYAFEANTGAGDRFLTLDLATWQQLVRWLMSQHQRRLRADISEYQNAINAISRHLWEQFPHNLREVLKNDAAGGGAAFSGMVLDLLRDNLAASHQIEIRQEDIINILKELNTGVRDELAQIRETLQQYSDLTKPRLPIPQSLDEIIAEKTQGFVGRQYVFKAIRNFLNQQPKGYFILEADPGVGKSAILARFVQLFKGHCLTHFNGQSLGAIDAKQFLTNICTQLIAGYGLNYPSLPENTTEGPDVLITLLREASQKLPPGKKLVVVVDALDEVDSSKQSTGSNVLYLPDALPNNVYFILSKRPQELLLPPPTYRRTFDLMQYPAESEIDARYYAEKRLQQSPQIQQWVTERNSTPETFLTELVAKSKNNFMYLRYVLNDINDGLYQNETLDGLPTGLREYYQKHWQIMGMNAEPLPIDKIRTIYVLSEAREPVSRRLLAQLMAVEEYTLPPVLKKWQQFLRLQKVEGETRYTVYHASFSDFLKEQAKESGVNLEDINRRMAENLAKGAPL